MERTGHGMKKKKGVIIFNSPQCPGKLVFVGISCFIPIRDTVGVIEVINWRSLLTRGMWDMRMTSGLVRRHSMGAVTKGSVYGSNSWRRYGNWASMKG